MHALLGMYAALTAGVLLQVSANSGHMQVAALVHFAWRLRRFEILAPKNKWYCCLPLSLLLLLLLLLLLQLFLLLWPLLLAVTASAVAATAVAATAVATSTAARAAASETTQKNDHSCNMAQAENICQLRLRTKLQAAVYKPVRTHRYCTYQYNSIVYSPVCWRVTPVVMCSLLLWPNRALHRATAAAALVRNEKIAAALATRTAGPASTTAQLPVYRWHQQR
eukprot:21120-Heterococcus_DN1.PRE.1